MEMNESVVYVLTSVSSLTNLYINPSTYFLCLVMTTGLIDVMGRRYMQVSKWMGMAISW